MVPAHQIARIASEGQVELLPRRFPWSPVGDGLSGPSKTLDHISRRARTGNQLNIHKLARASGRMEDAESRAVQCAQCQREIDLGADLLAITEGVLGPRGFVPLSKPRYMCSEACLDSQGEHRDVEKMRRRIP